MMNTSYKIKINIQLFAGEKTEKATPKKRKDAREKGQVFKSAEINSAVIMLVLFSALRIFAPYIFYNLLNLYDNLLSYNDSIDTVFTTDGIYNLSISLVSSVSWIILPIFGVALFTGIFVNYVQVGFLFTGKPLLPDLKRINPIEGTKKIFSKRAIVEFLKSLIKLSIIGSIIYTEFIKALESIPNMMGIEIIDSAIIMGNTAVNIGIKAGIALMIMAILDYIYQWWDFENNLKMSKQEVKDEYKQIEGDPHIRSKIKEKQRQIGMQRMMQEIPNADVVITNPTHFAVALKYDPQENDAPYVIAKGQNYTALKIKEKAISHNIFIIENKSLAQTLYKTTEIGQSIPPELFHAVAEVLAFVYNSKKH